MLQCSGSISKYPSLAKLWARWSTRRGRYLYSTEVPSPLTVLRKTDAILPRILPVEKDGSSDESILKYWRDVLNTSTQTIESKNAGPIEISVCGLDEWSGAGDLVTVLLEDIFSEDGVHRTALRERWKNASGNYLIIEYSPDLKRIGNTLSIPSAFLRERMVRIKEYKKLTPEFLQAEFPIIVCNLLSSSPDSVINHPLIQNNINAILVLSSALYVSPEFVKYSTKRKTLTIDSSRALNAVDSALENSPSGIQRYQADYTASRLSDLPEAIDAVTSASKSLASFHTCASLFRIDAALDTCKTNISRVKAELDKTSTAISELESVVEEVRVRTPKDVFGSPSDNIIDTALKEATHDMDAVMKKLTWWKLLWSVDETSSNVATAVQQLWCKNLENILVFHAGRLEFLQTELEKLSNRLLSNNKSIIDSPLLNNDLLQITASPTYNISFRTLIAPLETRRTQMSDYPTVRLHLSGQRTTLMIGGSATVGLGMSWAGWVGLLAGDPFTIAGSGLLAATLGIRWAISIWEKGKRRWWEDWHRVGAGLSRDLNSAVSKTLEQHVLIIAVSTTSGARELVEARREEIAALEEELDTLKHDLTAIRPASSHPF